MNLSGFDLARAGRTGLLLRSLLALLAGAAHALALAPQPRGWLQLAALTALALLLPERQPRRAAWLGWCFGLAWLLGSFFWLYVSMHRYGHLPAWLAAAAVLLLAAALALPTAAAAAAWSALWPAAQASWGARLRWFVGGALCWLGSELARGQWFTGFPWGASGYAQVDALPALLAPWLGVYGIGAAMAVLALACAGHACQGPQGWRWAAVLPVVALALLPAWRGPDFTRSTGTLTVTLLQGNVAQDEKFDPGLIPAVLAWHAQALLDARTTLVVTPETAVPLLPEQLPPGWWDGLKHELAQRGVAALVGRPLGDFDIGYTNSVSGVAPGLPEYRYDKRHLVPFGEVVPWGFRWFVDLMGIPLGDFGRGVRHPPSFEVGGQRLAPNICYEDLFGEELAERWAGEGAPPTVLANVSNIGWFGETVAVDQHLQISRMRSLELQRPMLRATNTGATAVIDHRGTVAARLPAFTRDVLVSRVEGRDGTSPYAWWAGRLGLWPMWLLALGGAAWAWRAARRP